MTWVQILFLCVWNVLMAFVFALVVRRPGDEPLEWRDSLPDREGYYVCYLYRAGRELRYSSYKVRFFTNQDLRRPLGSEYVCFYGPLPYNPKDWKNG